MSLQVVISQCDAVDLDGHFCCQPESSPDALLEAFLALADRLSRADAAATQAEAKLLATVRTSGAYRRIGHASFGDFARETLRVEASTAWDRVRLAGLFASWPLLEQCFLRGALGPCAALSLAPLLERRGKGDGEALPLPPVLPLPPWHPVAGGLTSTDVSPLVAWLRLAEVVPVRQLRALVRAALDPDPLEASPAMTATDVEDEVGRRITFSAPPVVRRLLEDSFDMARRMAGRQIPPGDCLELLLVEAAPDDAGSGDDASSSPSGREGSASHGGEAGTNPAHGPMRARAAMLERPRTRPNSVPSRHAATVRTRAMTKALAALKRIDPALVRIEGQLNRAGHQAGPDPDLIRRLQAVRALARPLRRLTGRLLTALQAAWEADALPIENLDDFLESRLRLSPRTLRRLLFESRLFSRRPDLEQAWLAGHISLSQAFDLQKRAPRARSSAWIARAGAVTARQLQRELLLFERLAMVLPEVARRCPGPFPSPCLAAELNLPAGDPAEDLLLHRQYEEALDRALLSSADLTPLHAAAAFDTTTPTWPTFGHVAGGNVAVTIAVSPAVAAHWHAAVQRLRTESESPIPTWMAAAIFCFRALRTWRAVDPDTRPTEWRTLERDDYLCQAPGCSSRRNLEAHHIVPRARGGPGALSNKITLCHSHHHHVLHAGHLRLRGRAPGRLHWTTRTEEWIGDRRVDPPL